MTATTVATRVSLRHCSASSLLAGLVAVSPGEVEVSSPSAVAARERSSPFMD